MDTMDKSNYISLMMPDIREKDIDAVAEVLRSGMLVQGKKVEALENSIAKYLGIKHAIAVSSGTASLHLALIALGIGPGDEVIVPAFSYIATVNVVELVNAKPIFVDIDLDTFNIDVSQIEEKITKKTKAIIPVHEFGLACNVREIMQIAQKHNLKVIEDAACALGTTDREQFAGTFGDVGSFSFHPRKVITGGEGGMLVTNDDKLAAKFRILRNHGIKTENGKTEFVAAGFNYRMTDFQAVLVFSQFQRLEQIFEKRNELAKIYLNELAGLKSVKPPHLTERKRHTWQTFHILIEDSVNRNHIIEKLKNQGIGTNLGAQCMPYQEFFQKKYRLDCKKLFPNAMRAYTQGLALPLYEKLGREQVFMISGVLKEIFHHETA